MSNKKKKAKKQVNPEIAANIFLGLKTTISNDACIKAAREWKGALNIVPIVLALGSVVLALVPYFVQQNGLQGSTAVLGTPSSSYETGLSQLIHSLAYDSNGNERPEAITLEVTAEGKLHFVNNTTDFFNSGSGQDGWYTITRKEENADKDLQDQIMFEAFFNTAPATTTDEMFYSYIDAFKNPFTGNLRDSQVEVFKGSYIAFGRESVRFRHRNEIVAFTGLTGSYELLKGKSLTDFAASLKGQDVNSSQYINSVKTYFVDFVNKSYEPAKQKGLWMYTGIFFGVDLGAMILFGLMLFLMTRGKKNPFRIYTFWETQKMAYFAAPTPALLSLIGFAIPNMAFILFFFIFGFRMMWMSMKSMRPIAQ